MHQTYEYEMDHRQTKNVVLDGSDEPKCHTTTYRPIGARITRVKRCAEEPTERGGTPHTWRTDARSASWPRGLSPRPAPSRAVRVLAAGSAWACRGWRAWRHLGRGLQVKVKDRGRDVVGPDLANAG